VITLSGIKSNFVTNQKNQQIQIFFNFCGLGWKLVEDTKLVILRLLEHYGSLMLPKISELSKLSELSCASTLSNLISQGLVFTVGDIFSLFFQWKRMSKENQKVMRSGIYFQIQIRVSWLWYNTSWYISDCRAVSRESANTGGMQRANTTLPSYAGYREMLSRSGIRTVQWWSLRLNINCLLACRSRMEECLLTYHRIFRKVDSKTAKWPNQLFRLLASWRACRCEKQTRDHLHDRLCEVCCKRDCK